MKKRIISLLCVMAMLFALMCGAVYAADDVVLINEDISVASGWQSVTQVNTTNWGGTVAPDFMTEGGSYTLVISGENIWSMHLVLSGVSNSWVQLDRESGTFTANGDGTYSVTFSYDDCATAYNGAPTDLNAVYVYSDSDAGAGVTVHSLVYTAGESAPEETEPEVTEPEVTEPEVTEPEATEPEVTEPEVTEPEATEPEITEPEATEPEVTEPEATEPEVTEPEVTEPEDTTPDETVPEVVAPAGVTKIYSGSTAASGWNMTCEVYTTNWGGDLNPLFITEGGQLVVTCTSNEFWQISVALNSGAWVQLDAHVEEAQRNAGTITDLGDGKYMVSFTYDELVSAYGGSDFSSLGAVYVYSNSGGDTVVTNVAYYPAGTNPGTGVLLPVAAAIVGTASILGLGITIHKRKELN